MSLPVPYQLQPQPPSHPKPTIGGKRGPSGPISIPSSSSEDEDNETLGDFSPPQPSRILQAAPINCNVKPAIVLPLDLQSPRTSQKKNVITSPRLVNNNNLTAINFNHCNTTIHNSNLNNSSTTSNSIIVVTPAIHLQNNSMNVFALTANDISSNHVSKNMKPTVIDSVLDHSSEPASIKTKATDTVSVPDLSGDVNEEVIETSPFAERNSLCTSPSQFAYEHDHDYENVASPCSSTASGPIYERPPGFQHHAQEILVTTQQLKLKKKKTLSSLKDQTQPKLKPKRDPLPMKLRALPQSFFQQPNVPQQVPPTSMFPILPPLTKDSDEILMEERSVSPQGEPEKEVKLQKVPERKLTVANTDLLFKLFEGVSEEKRTQTAPKNRPAHRQRKVVPKSNSKGLLLGNDPYMMDAISEKIFPKLSIENSRYATNSGNTSLQLITLKEGDRTVTLPSLSLDQNYPQMLSELVSII